MEKLSLLLALLGAPAAQAQKVKIKTKGRAALVTNADARWPAAKAHARYNAHP